MIESPCGFFHKSELLIIRVLLFGVYKRVHDFWKRPDAPIFQIFDCYKRFAKKTSSSGSHCSGGNGA